MTETSTQNYDVQNEWYIKNEKQQCRKIALEYASKLGCHTTASLLKETRDIYDWLTEDLK
jgi:hypothetical protein